MNRRTALWLAILGSVVLAAQARAHAFLDHADPAVGSVLKQAPPRVSLWFTEGLEAAFSSVKVFDPAGREVDGRDARLDAKDSHRFGVSLPGSLPPGLYQVTWRAVSVDTHVTSGDFTFRVQP